MRSTVVADDAVAGVDGDGVPMRHGFIQGCYARCRPAPKQRVARYY